MSESFSDYGINVKITGGEEDTTCPECSHTRKKKTDRCLSVHTGDGTWLCQHCGWRGSLGTRREWDVAKRRAHVGKVYVKPDYDGPTVLPDECIKFFLGRGISAEILKRESIGYSKAVLTIYEDFAKAPKKCPLIKPEFNKSYDGNMLIINYFCC